MFSHVLGVGLGFSHWFGPTLGSPDGFTTPVVHVSVRPGVDFLEIRARFTPNLGEGEVRGFGGGALLVRHSLRVGRQEVGVLAGPEVLGVATMEALRPGVGAVVGAELLIAAGAEGSPRFGGFFAAHEVIYTLPGDAGSSLFSGARRDVQVDLGFQVSIF